MVEEVSEERSGDQPVADDDATTAPVPERVSPGRTRATDPRTSRLNLDSNNALKKAAPPDVPLPIPSSNRRPRSVAPRFTSWNVSWVRVVSARCTWGGG